MSKIKYHVSKIKVANHNRHSKMQIRELQKLFVRTCLAIMFRYSFLFLIILFIFKYLITFVTYFRVGLNFLKYLALFLDKVTFLLRILKFR